VALTDGSGTIYEPQGLDLQFLVGLFQAGKPISFYPPEKLSPGAILLDKFSKRAATPFAQQTLCWKKLANGQLVEEWMSGGEMNSLLRNNVHQTTADIFIPAGGRPRTLNENNIQEFLDKSGKPTAKAIVEGANLYLTPRARSTLEKLGVLIIQDSSANKTGVICSSFEILCGLALGEKEFMAHKGVLVNEILERLKECAANEANLLFRTHQATGEPLTEISARISKKINLYTYQLLDFLTPQTLDLDPETPLMRCFFSYCLPTLREHFRKELLREIPDIHKKAIIACHLGAQLVYSKGLSWHPTVVDVLPILLSQ
jgi:glutamate dehydrogenase